MAIKQAPWVEKLSELDWSVPFPATRRKWRSAPMGPGYAFFIFGDTESGNAIDEEPEYTGYALVKRVDETLSVVDSGSISSLFPNAGFELFTDLTSLDDTRVVVYVQYRSDGATQAVNHDIAVVPFTRKGDSIHVGSPTVVYLEEDLERAGVLPPGDYGDRFVLSDAFGEQEPIANLGGGRFAVFWTAEWIPSGASYAVEGLAGRVGVWGPSGITMGDFTAPFFHGKYGQEGTGNPSFPNWEVRMQANASGSHEGRYVAMPVVSADLWIALVDTDGNKITPIDERKVPTQLPPDWADGSLFFLSLAADGPRRGQLFVSYFPEDGDIHFDICEYTFTEGRLEVVNRDHTTDIEYWSGTDFSLGRQALQVAPGLTMFEFHDYQFSGGQDVYNQNLYFYSGGRGSCGRGYGWINRNVEHTENGYPASPSGAFQPGNFYGWSPMGEWYFVAAQSGGSGFDFGLFKFHICEESKVVDSRMVGMSRDAGHQYKTEYWG